MDGGRARRGAEQAADCAAAEALRGAPPSISDTRRAPAFDGTPLHAPHRLPSQRPGGVLPQRVAERLSGRFGDLPWQVAVHCDDANCRQLGAHAYAVGRDIAFAPGQYRPHDAAGLRLIAHELAHVEQQQRSGPTLQCEAAPGADVDIYELTAEARRTVGDALALRQQFVLAALRGPGANSRVDDRTADLVEALIETSAFLAPFLRGRLASTSVRKNLIRHDNDAAFLAEADRLDHVVRPITGAANRAPSGRWASTIDAPTASTWRSTPGSATRCTRPCTAIRR